MSANDPKQTFASHHKSTPSIVPADKPPTKRALNSCVPDEIRLATS